MSKLRPPTTTTWRIPRSVAAKAPLYIFIVPLADELQLVLTSVLVVALVAFLARLNR